MRPRVWQPPIEPTPAESAVMQRVKRAKLFVFLREHRHELFDERFQEELGKIYQDSTLGQPPVPPAKLALAPILQAYTGVSDDEAIEAMVMDRRWQLVLGCLDAQEQTPFSKSTLVAFRKRLIDHEMDRRLVERTVEVAQRRGGFGSRRLRAALDSSPLWGAGRVEDTHNLLGHALKKALGVIARQQGRGLAEVAEEAGASLLGGTTSLKAALDLDWDEPEERAQALVRVLEALDAMEAYLVAEGEAQEETEAAGQGSPLVGPPPAGMEVARRVREQDIVEQEDGGPPILRRGVAKERLVSVEDPQMRHGRKSKSVRFSGYKRHVLRDLDTGLVRAVGVTPANVPEASVTEDIARDLARQPEAELGELHIDRAYLSSELVREREPDLEVYCKAWRVRNGECFPKTEFMLDFERGLMRCPAGAVMPFDPGGVVRFPKKRCASCPLRERCTKSKTGGRSVSVHPDERLLAELRERQSTPEGRKKLRERVDVEHSLAHIGHWQGARARYKGVRKNLLDLRRSAVVHNLHVIARTPSERSVKEAA
ncbi:MAG: IS1182 family transposase [Rubrobacteraceae bacterium]|nr:IS1182 family transposase [Rubrobacteraceae bacterium]